MSLITEFKEFAIKGNVADMAVGIIIGGAFGKIVSSVVSDLLMPPLGFIIGGVNFSGLRLVLKEGENGVAPVTLNYGAFLQTTFDFFIVAFAIFLVIKAMNSLRKSDEKAPATPPPPTREELLLMEIRDALKGSTASRS